MNFDFILECGCEDAGRMEQYRKIYHMLDNAEHIYWEKPQECGILLREAALAICFVYNERYEIGFAADADLEEFLCYTNEEAHNRKVSMFLSVARKEQRDRLNRLRVTGDDCVMGEAAPDRGMALRDRMAQNAKRMMDTMITTAADMCNRMEGSGFSIDMMEFREEALPEQPGKPMPQKKKFWEKVFRSKREW
jgi:hypothetical protein